MAYFAKAADKHHYILQQLTITAGTDKQLGLEVLYYLCLSNMEICPVEAMIECVNGYLTSSVLTQLLTSMSSLSLKILS